MNLATLLLVTASSVLVLRSGDRIEIEGAAREENGQVVFRIPGGTLYSIPAAEVDLAATKAGIAPAQSQAEPGGRRIRIRVSDAERDRLLRELEKNHSGQPAMPQQSYSLQPGPSAWDIAAAQRDEWQWRREARAYEEGVRQAQEHLQLLNNRVDRLQGEIRGLLSLGFQPRQFTYQTTMLHLTREQIPSAELTVTQAERANSQFRDDARRQGVLPGWLR
jgi:hypothetical protein